MSNDTHDYCWRTLPWFVTGRLSASDAQRIERHLEECAACRTELSEQRELCMHIRRDEPLLLAPQASLQKMMARIETGMPTGELADLSATEELPPADARKPRSYRWLAIAAAIQTVAIAALLAIVWRQTANDLTAPRYVTLSTAQAAAIEGPVFRVVFRPETPASRVQNLLQSVNAQIIAGPTEAGVYTLKLMNASAAGADALLQVRAEGSVIFAEQVAVEREP